MRSGFRRYGARIADVSTHWERVYAEKSPEQTSWFEASPANSLRLIEALGLSRDAALVDVGGGTSHLAGELLRRGYSDLTVVDVSARALKRAGRDLGAAAGEVTWHVGDARALDLGREFDLWHDRATYHFMVDAGDRAAYADSLYSHLRPGGHAIIATFGPDGPTECSGLPVHRYGADELKDGLGGGLALIASELVDHTTPGGNVQQFLYATLQRSDAPPYETVDAVLAEARAALDRLSPAGARAAQTAGAVLVDIRPASQRAADGEIPGARVIPRNVLEWRIDPSCPHRDPALARRDLRIVVVCNEGYQSSLAAATLRRFGVDATDLVGGFQAWRAAGQPVEPAAG